MRVSFRNRQLERCFEQTDRAIHEWGPVVGARYGARVKVLLNASSFQAVREIRALRLHALHGKRRGQFAITLNAQWRLIVQLGEEPNSVEIVEVTNHYDD